MNIGKINSIEIHCDHEVLLYLVLHDHIEC